MLRMLPSESRTAKRNPGCTIKQGVTMDLGFPPRKSWIRGTPFAEYRSTKQFHITDATRYNTGVFQARKLILPSGCS